MTTLLEPDALDPASDDRKLLLAGDPMIVLVDACDGERIQNLIPEHRGQLTEWISGADFQIGGAR